MIWRNQLDLRIWYEPVIEIWVANFRYFDCNLPARYQHYSSCDCNGRLLLLLLLLLLLSSSSSSSPPPPPPFERSPPIVAPRHVCPNFPTSASINLSGDNEHKGKACFAENGLACRESHIKTRPTTASKRLDWFHQPRHYSARNVCVQQRSSSATNDCGAQRTENVMILLPSFASVQICHPDSIDSDAGIRTSGWDQIPCLGRWAL